ncbi:MAG: tetratricopeptide repeat protein [Gallionella sp.]|nr:tetratricopeptide repeat protein [Gallionella sp.]
MELSPEALNALLSELKTIRLLLLVIVGLGLFLVIPLFAISRSISHAGELVKQQNDTNATQAELENLLASGQAIAAKFAAIEWLARQPNQAQGHWLLAKAHYQLGELVEAKKVFQALVKIAPDWEFSVNPWLERIESEIQASGPRVVK